MEHGVPGTRHPGVGRGRQAGGRRAAAIPVAAGLGAHQPNRRLRLAAEPQTGRREVSALTDARKTLAYDFFRILRAPRLRRRSHAILNKGESRHALARAIFLHQLGEFRNRAAETMAHRASGLNLVVNAI
ncbi:transposase, partial [Escherichia coli]|nr:transposase [Escherichia coli]